MARLLIHVEGQTEESFVNDVLAPHLSSFGYEKIGARLMGNSRQRANRGGVRAWPVVQKDIVNHLKEDDGCLATIMVDYYAMPPTWPGRQIAATVIFAQKARTVQDAISAAVCEEMGSNFDGRRFIPYVMMHEFEALLFSDCDIFSASVGRYDLAPKLQEIRMAFNTPEEINDRPDFAPSKRILGLMPEYQKPLHGILASLDIGLAVMRRECANFAAWLNALEGKIAQN